MVVVVTAVVGAALVGAAVVGPSCVSVVVDAGAVEEELLHAAV
jgi:hypothetical protein